MIRSLLDLKLNVLIVVGGAFLTLVSIKAMSVFLPAKYYFSFAQLVGRGAEPMIVDPPGVTGQKLCDILDKKGLPKDLFGGPVNCRAAYDATFSPLEIAQIIDRAMRSEAMVRDGFRQVADRIAIAPIPDAELSDILARNATAKDVVDRIYESYKAQLDNATGGGLRQAVEALYVSFKREGPATNEDNAHDEALSDAARARLRAAHQKFAAGLGALEPGADLAPLTRITVEGFLKNVSNYGADVSGDIYQFYNNQLQANLRSRIDAAFSRFLAGEAAAARRSETGKLEVFKEINSFSWNNYILSVLIRMAPVFCLGFCFGILLGRTEVASIGMAGGLAAFLLCWPLVVMWDVVVVGTYADKRATFILLYLVYIFAFYLTARSSALLAAWLCEHKILGLKAPWRDARALTAVTWRQLAVNMAGATALTTAAFGWNLLIPIGTR